MKQQPLFIFLFCLFVVMTGYGLTLPVLSYYIERLTVNGNATTGQAGGPIVGGTMIRWQAHIPHLLTSLLLGIAAFYTLVFIRRGGH